MHMHRHTETKIKAETRRNALQTSKAREKESFLSILHQILTTLFVERKIVLSILFARALKHISTSSMQVLSSITNPIAIQNLKKTKQKKKREKTKLCPSKYILYFIQMASAFDGLFFSPKATKKKNNNDTKLKSTFNTGRFCSSQTMHSHKHIAREADMK